MRRRRNGLTRFPACWQDLSSAFPELLAEVGRRLRREAALLDAEIVCLNCEGRPDVGAVRARMHSSKARDGANSEAAS